MTSHQHIDRAGSALEKAARDTMLRAGEQWTKMRGAVFQALLGFGQPASAYDVADIVSQRLDRRVAPNSVYRILDLFVACNLATRVESRNAYLANSHPECRHDCIFLVCDSCGAAMHIDDDPVADTLRQAARRAGFTPERPVIEVRGRCARCAGAVA